MSFFKAKANIKTSILHLRKKSTANEQQCGIFMSISNNIGHDNSLRDTPFRNNLTETLLAYLEWQRTGILKDTLRNNTDASENLECPQQYWLIKSEQLTEERFDTFFIVLIYMEHTGICRKLCRQKKFSLLKHLH